MKRKEEREGRGKEGRKEGDGELKETVKLCVEKLKTKEA